MKDVSPYVEESIMNIYGAIVKVKLDSYDGLTAKEIAKHVLNVYGMPNAEIESKLDRYLEDLPYSYYNVSWKGKMNVLDGMVELLNELKQKNVLVGVATGDEEKITKMRLQEAKISEYFKFGSYNENGFYMKDILSHALSTIEKDYNLPKKAGVFVSCSPVYIKSSSDLGLKSIGIETSRHSKQELELAGASTVLKDLKDRSTILKMLIQ